MKKTYAHKQQKNYKPAHVNNRIHSVAYESIQLTKHIRMHCTLLYMFFIST